MYAGRAATGDETGTFIHEPAAPATPGPRLILVHGVYEGKSFPLSKPPASGAWMIGRSSQADVTLDYDGYVSSEHARIQRVGKDLVLRDNASKNGVRINWRPLGSDAAHALRPGDVVGIGRSLLLYVEA